MCESRHFPGQIVVLAVCLMLCGLQGVRAETEQEMDEREAKEHEEEKKLIGQDFVHEVTIKGTVELLPLDDNGNIPSKAGTIVGFLVEGDKKTGEQRSFILKLKDPKLMRPRIAALGTKEVQLRGQLMNKEKYLFVVDVDTKVELKQVPLEGL